MERRAPDSSAQPPVEATEADRAASPPPPAHDGKTARKRTRTSVAFNALIAGVLVLILLLVFILENTQSVKVSYFGATGHVPLGVALLVAAVGGALLTGLAGAARVVQLRHRIKRRERSG